MITAQHTERVNLQFLEFPFLQKGLIRLQVLNKKRKDTGLPFPEKTHFSHIRTSFSSVWLFQRLNSNIAAQKKNPSCKSTAAGSLSRTPWPNSWQIQSGALKQALQQYEPTYRLAVFFFLTVSCSLCTWISLRVLSLDTYAFVLCVQIWLPSHTVYTQAANLESYTARSISSHCTIYISIFSVEEGKKKSITWSFYTVHTSHKAAF